MTMDIKKPAPGPAQRRGSGTAVNAEPNGSENVSVAIRMSPDMHRRLKIASAFLDVRHSAFVTEVLEREINAVLQKYNYTGNTSDG